MRLGFGLDLAGYSTGKSELAAALVSENSTSVILLSDSPFSKKVKADCSRLKVEAREADCLRKLLSKGAVAVDVPIDLQGLPQSPTSDFIWGRTKRPIDVALGALPPLADKIGAVVARFQGAIEADNMASLLGKRLYETYPAATFTCLGINTKGYKNLREITIRDEICVKLGFKTHQLNDDQIDAIVCALTAAAPEELVLEGYRLEQERLSTFANAKAPAGYRLLKILPSETIELSIISYADWMSSNGH